MTATPGRARPLCPAARRAVRRAAARRLLLRLAPWTVEVPTQAQVCAAAPAPLPASVFASALVLRCTFVAAVGATLALGAPPVRAQAPAPAPLASLTALEVPPYMGTWYQVGLFPNFFQRQCVSDTMATYRQLPDRSVEVRNRCRTADGKLDEALGQARPTGSLSGTTLSPAQLEVSFLPAWVRWLPVGWGRYWVIQLADDGRYAVISEPTRQYLWILSRQPRLAPADEAAIRARLAEQGFNDLSRLQPHPHGRNPG